MRTLLFAVFFGGTFWATSYFLPASFEKPLEFFGKKILYACAGAVLLLVVAVHILSFSVFPLLNSGILTTLFGNPDIMFYWFVAPLVLVAFF